MCWLFLVSLIRYANEQIDKGSIVIKISSKRIRSSLLSLTISKFSFLAVFIFPTTSSWLTLSGWLFLFLILNLRRFVPCGERESERERRQTWWDESKVIVVITWFFLCDLGRKGWNLQTLAELQKELQVPTHVTLSPLLQRLPRKKW